MKIFDCFMYFDEDIVLDVRLNYLDKYVDQFIIIESEYLRAFFKKNLKLLLMPGKLFSSRPTFSLYVFKEATKNYSSSS